ncbi:hypothetical protein AAFP30_02565 [Gordonia sp. CPCC 205515]|uniref:hypothetical protein n=1 Tax=Gordonia sp. CPCC 205515 TaxID=3140791 RepID=UPI003AF345B1
MTDRAVQRHYDNRIRTRVLALAVLPALCAAAVGALMLASWRDRLPDPVASHWSTHGVNGYSSLTAVIVFVLVTGVVGALIGAALCWRVVEPAVVRSIVGIVAGVSVSVIVMIVATTGAQRGVTDASGVPTPTWQIAVALVIGLAVGFVCAALVPRWHNPAAPGSDPHLPMADLDATERFSWTRTVSSSPMTGVIVGGAFIVIAALAVLTRSWPMAVLMVILAVPMVMLWSIRVTVDRSGVTVRSAIGWPRIRIPVDDIDHAEVVDVRAIGDFGGYGYRLCVHGKLKGAKGFVLRSGPGLLIGRTDGRREIIVVDDADTAAGLVNHVVRHGGPGPRRQADSTP